MIAFLTYYVLFACVHFISLTSAAWCPPGWTAFKNEKCVIYLPYESPHNEASYSCRGRNPNATLISVNSEPEEEFLIGLARRHLKGKYSQWIWLGAKRNENENFTKWVDGSNVRYSNWYQGLGYSCPDIERTRNCIAMGIFAEKEGSIWCNFDCSTSLHRFCQILLTPQTFEGPEVSRLGQGERLEYSNDYKRFTIGNMDLMLYPDLVSGEQAPLMCPVGELLTIRSDQDEEELIDYLKNNISTLTQPIWIGLKRNGSGSDDSNWYWTDGSELNYTNWGRSEPNNNGRWGEYCVMLDLDRRTWHDVSCGDRYHLICDQYVEDDSGLWAWLRRQYIERGILSALLWLFTLTILATTVILCTFCYLAFKERMARVALLANHETKAYSKCHMQDTECDCFNKTNLYDQ